MIRSLSPDDILKEGLKLVGFGENRQSITWQTNLERFKYHHGSLPIVLAHIWEDLQLTTDLEAWVDGTDSNLKYLFLACHLLKCYKLEVKLAAMLGISECTACNKGWLFVSKIQALKLEKVSHLCIQYITITATNFFDLLQIIWPTELVDSLEVPTVLFSVDGVHCRIQEPSNGIYTRDPAYFSHKHKTAAYNYKLILSVHTNQLVWMNGPYPAGRNDITMFKTNGLKKQNE